MPGEFGGPSPEEQRIKPAEPAEETSREAGELSSETRKTFTGEMAELEGNVAKIRRVEAALDDPTEYRSLVAQLGDEERQRLEETIARLLEELRERKLSIRSAAAPLNPRDIVNHLVNSGGVERLSSLLGYLSGGAQILGAAGLMSEVGDLLRTKHQLRRAEDKLRELTQY